MTQEMKNKIFKELRNAYQEQEDSMYRVKIAETMEERGDAYKEYTFYKGKAEGMLECVKLLGLMEEFNAHK